MNCNSSASSTGSSESSAPPEAPRPPPQLCSYSDTSDEDSELPPTEHGGQSSPRKRRRQNKVPHWEALDLHPTKTDGVLDVDQIFAADYDLTAGLVEGFERILPGFKDSEPLNVEDFFLPDPEIVDPIKTKVVEFEFDAESFELKPVVKKPKSEEWSAGQSTSSGTVTAGTSAASESSQNESEFKKPKLRNRKFIFKPFLRQADGRLVHNDSAPPLDVVIPEQLAASYGLYIWPCSPVLSWYLWLHQDELRGKNVLELGAGTSLPGLLCSKLGAEHVWLSDDATAPNILSNCEEAVRLNELKDKVSVIGITWGSFDADVLNFENTLDYIIGSDLFFDPEVFEPLCVTLSFLLKRNPGAQVFISVQERSEYWTVEENFLRWNLKGKIISPEEFLAGTGIEESDLTDRHTIYILNITLSSADNC